MTKTANNTHRRPMRPMTPALRAGRVAAGAVMATTVLLGGGAVASADGPTAADGPDTRPQSLTEDQAPAVIPTAEVAAQTLTDGGASKKDAKKKGSVSAAAQGQSFADITVQAPPEPEPEPEPEVQDEPAQQDDQQNDQAPAQDTSGNEQNGRQDDAAGDDSSQDQSQNQGNGESSKSNGNGESSKSNGNSNGSSKKKSEDSTSKDEGKKSGGSGAVKGGSVVATARNGIGTPYVFGGTSTSGWDCSGFVQWVYGQHGVSLPRGAADQANAGTRISKSEAKPGDLVYTPGHIGIYAGGDMMIDAGNQRVGTSERHIYSGNWEYIRIG